MLLSFTGQKNMSDIHIPIIRMELLKGMEAFSFDVVENATKPQNSFDLLMSITQGFIQWGAGWKLPPPKSTASPTQKTNCCGSLLMDTIVPV